MRATNNDGQYRQRAVEPVVVVVSAAAALDLLRAESIYRRAQRLVTDPGLTQGATKGKFSKGEEQAFDDVIIRSNAWTLPSLIILPSSPLRPP